MNIVQVAMCNFPTIKDAADVAIATMHSGIQVSASDWIQAISWVSWCQYQGFFLPANIVLVPHLLLL